MVKRRNENGQMRREEYEAAEDSASMNSLELGFQRATEDSIRKRKIVKAKLGSRPPVASKPITDDVTKSNPFGGFQGLTAAKHGTTASSLTGFSGFSDSTAATNDSITKSIVASGLASSAGTQQSEYRLKIERLNKEFLAFVNGQMQTNPSVSWLAAVQDYLKYANEITIKHVSSDPFTNDIDSAKPLTPTHTAAFSFGENHVTSTKGDGSSSSSLTDTNKFDNKQGKPASKSFSSGFSFGCADSSLFKAKSSNSQDTVIPAFSFETLPKPSTVGPEKAFSFGTSSSNCLKPSEVSTSAAGDEDDEKIGHEEATLIIKDTSTDDDCTFEIEKAKIFEFRKEEQRWVDKGVHPLKVLVSKTTKNGRILVRNEIGKIVVNAALYKGLSVRPHESKGKKTGVTMTLQVDGQMTQFLLKVNAARVNDLVDALHSAIG